MTASTPHGRDQASQEQAGQQTAAALQRIRVARQGPVTPPLGRPNTARTIEVATARREA